MSKIAPVTLITGTSRGIGRYLAQHYVEQNHIVVGCSRNPSSWSTPGYHHIPTDLTNEYSIRDLFKWLNTELGRLDNLINCAGIAAMNHSLLTPLATVKKILDTNLIASFLVMRDSAKLMQKNKYGRIVNFTTVAVPLKIEGEAIYAASKAAVLALTQVMARELAPFGITINCIGPTPVDTDLIRAVPKAKLDAIIARQAIPRMGTLQDISNVIDFFIKPESNFITGQCLYLGGV